MPPFLAWVVPRGDWVSEYPSTNGRIIVGIRLSYLYVLAMLACAIADSFLPAKFALTEQALTAFEITGWFLGAMLAISAGQYVGKRGTAKPEVIAAEAEASVKKIQATAAAVPPLTPTQAVEAGKLPDAVGESKPVVVIPLPTPTTPTTMETQ